MAATAKQPSTVSTQVDFSAGEVDPQLKRGSDHPMLKAGARQMSNMRILNSRTVQNRPGRRALYSPSPTTDRVDRILMYASTFDLAFGEGTLSVYNSAGARVYTTAGLPWTGATRHEIVWASFGLVIWITFPGMQPRILTWDGVSSWTLTTFIAAIANGSQKRTIFYRLSPKGVLMKPSATTGNITMDFSMPIAVAGMVGTTMRYCGRQIAVTAFNSSTQLAGTVQESLPPSQTITLTGPVGAFNVGDLVEGNTSNARGIVITTPSQQTLRFNSPTTPPFGAFNPGDAVAGSVSGATGVVVSFDAFTHTMVVNLTAGVFGVTDVVTGPSGSGTLFFVYGVTLVVQLLQTARNNNLSTLVNIPFVTTAASPGFIVNDVIIGPSGSATIATIATGVPQFVTVWDEEVMNSFRGWPASVFFDQNRLGLCNFPALLGGIAWSANGIYDDFYPDASPDNAIFEIAPDKTQVFFVVPGPESGEFVFCDRKLFYIRIDATNPLKPGSVAFSVLDSDGAAQVQPRPIKEVIFYVGSGNRRVCAVQAPGAYYRPYNTLEVSENHNHLFSNIIALAVPTADSTFPEDYAYAYNANGNLVVGKYMTKNGLLEGMIGWVPWSGNGTMSWVSALSADVIFTTQYAPNGIAARHVVEILDDTRYLDASQHYNAQPSGLPIPGGKGPLWYLAGGSVDVMDGPAGTRMMGTYQIDANGFLVPQFNAGEDFTSANLVVGQAWTATLEPYVPPVQLGQDVGQRMWPRRIMRAQAYVINSSGFVMERLYSDQTGPNLPQPGTVMKQRRIATWNVDEDPTQPPVLREQSYLDRPLGRSHDPRWSLSKDTPGPLIVAEVSFEVTI